MGDLDGALAHRDEPAVGQRREHVGDVLVPFEVELRERSAAANRCVALVLADEAQHERADDGLAGLGDTVVRLLGQPGDGPVHPAGLSVRSGGERVVLPLLPQLEQRGGEERQRAGLALDVVDERVHELRLDAQPDPARRELDGAPQLRPLHGPDEHLVRPEQLGELRIRREAAVEVGAHSDDDDRATDRIAAARASVAAKAARSASERHAVKSSSSWSTARSSRASVGSVSRASRERIARTRDEDTAELLHRMLPGTQQEPPPALAAREDSPASAGRPARRTDDLPLPEGPTMPRKPAPTRRATSSATSRSRPKK